MTTLVTVKLTVTLDNLVGEIFAVIGNVKITKTVLEIRNAGEDNAFPFASKNETFLDKKSAFYCIAAKDSNVQEECLVSMENVTKVASQDNAYLEK